MKRILFVDDETQILKAFVRAFSDDDFEVITTESVENAFEVLAKGGIHMVISDMRMPVMNGYDFLSTVKEKYPSVLRVLLSGYSDERIVFKALQKNIAKLYMFKPWENKRLKSTISNLIETQDILNDHDLLTLISNVDHLPTIPDNYIKVIRLIEDEAGALEISRFIEQDQSMASKILHVANSAYYGGKTGSIQQAVTQIGLKGTRELVLSTSIIDAFSNEKSLQSKMEKIWDHAFMTNKMLHYIYNKILEKKLPQDYQSAGLLHNIGVVFLLNYFGRKYLELMVELKKEGKEVVDLERSKFGSTHMEAGGYLLDYWGFPFSMVEAALYHHNPFNEHIVNGELINALHAAQYFAGKKTGSLIYENIDLRLFEVLNVPQADFIKIMKEFDN